VFDPDLESIVKQFGEKIHTEIVTNGDPLNEKMISELYDAGLDMLIVSLYDGPHQIDEFKDLFSAVGIGEEKYVLRDRWYDIEEDYGVKLTNRSGTVKVGNQQEVDPTKPCYYTHYSMMVDWNGDVNLCVQDWNKKVKFGNLYSKSLLEVWKSHNNDFEYKFPNLTFLFQS
jgi:sulfatase maturation enzyme AslB (radical SAM superfamily)